VRTIGDPDIRFREDPIRILRAIKFAARLDFEIESKTAASLHRNRHELNKAAPPRVLEEINRFCRGGAAKSSFEILGKTGVFEIVFSEIAKAYARRPEAWSLMLSFLERMDHGRPVNRGEIRTGEILAATLLPVLAPQVGWNDDGTVSRPGGLNLRGLIDEVLKPMALRLRIPRREQEHCRQILGTLFRMVPSRRVRRSMQRAVLNRECLPDVLWILEVLAERLGQDFSEAHRFWTAEGQQRSAQGTEGAEAPKRAAGTRVRRRRSRRRASTGPATQAPHSSEQDEQPGDKDEQHDRPTPWHDDSFFASLPSAPEPAGEDTKGKATDAAASPAESGADGPADESSPKPRRRRRRRRRRAGSSAGAAGDESPEPAAPENSDGNEAPQKE
jgi:poly(A) polymerase